MKLIFRAKINWNRVYIFYLNVTWCCNNNDYYLLLRNDLHCTKHNSNLWHWLSATLVSRYYGDPHVSDGVRLAHASIALEPGCEQANSYLSYILALATFWTHPGNFKKYEYLNPSPRHTDVLGVRCKPEDFINSPEILVWNKDWGPPFDQVCS